MVGLNCGDLVWIVYIGNVKDLYILEMFGVVLFGNIVGVVIQVILIVFNRVEDQIVMYVDIILVIGVYYG